MSLATSRHVLALAFAAATAILPGCSTYKPAPKAFHEATIQPYTLDAGDRLHAAGKGDAQVLDFQKIAAAH